jgi:dihydroflavonol-4-reductase
MSTPKNNLVLLTGASGLVGGHLLIRLVQSGRQVRAMVRPSSSFTQLQRICSFYGMSYDTLKTSVEWVYGDTLDFVGLLDIMNGVKEIYHCAAMVSFNEKNCDELMQTNIKGTANMVDAAKQTGVEMFCFISSIASLGTTSDGSFITENTPRKSDKESSAYSESKFKSELEVWRAISEGLNAVIVNPGVILGPGDPEKGSLLIFKNGRKGIPFYTKATTGYVDVRDICRASMELMEKGLFGKRFILVSDNVHNGKIFGLITQEYGKKAPILEAGKHLLNFAAFLSGIAGIITGKTPQFTKDTVRSAQHPQQFSNAAVVEALNYDFIPLKQTIKDTCDFLKSQSI